MDCMDPKLFNLARRPAMQNSSQTWSRGHRLPELRSAETKLTEPPTDKVVMAAPQDADTARRPDCHVDLHDGGRWGIGFGVMGTAWPRKDANAHDLLYAIFTGSAPFALDPRFLHLRFLTGLGVGGVFAAAVHAPGRKHARPIGALS